MDNLDNLQPDNNPKEEQKRIARNDAIAELEQYLEGFTKLPTHEKFSFALNVDIYYLGKYIANILKMER